jgi:hypothetical protein
MKRTLWDNKRSRPFFCYDRRCKVIFSTYRKEDYERGFSFFCYGKLREKNVFTISEAVHENDMCHCYYTPLKGAIRWFVNEQDLWGELNAKIAVLNRIVKPKCQKCGADTYKVVTHRCTKCGD